MSFPRRFEPCSQRRISEFCSVVKSQLSTNILKKMPFPKYCSSEKRKFYQTTSPVSLLGKKSHILAARKTIDDWRFPSSCDGRVVKVLDLKSNGSFARRFEPCSHRRISEFCSVVKSQLSTNIFKKMPFPKYCSSEKGKFYQTTSPVSLLGKNLTF